MNLEYSEKIIRFIENEFSIDRVFPTQLIFIKQFLNNAFDSMVLSIYKLYFDRGNIVKKQIVELSIFKLFLIKNYYKLRKVKGLF